MPGALAADAVMPVKAPAVVVVDTPWWTHGFVEVGGRGFLNNPTYGGHIFQGQGSLAKYYEYSTVKPGPFGDFNFAAGSKDGLYEIDAWGKNVGYSDQRYDAYLSKAGEQYFNFMWDQTPHVYSTSGSTLFNTNGNALTLINPNIGAQIFAAPGGAGFSTIPNGTSAKANAISTIINSNVVPTDVGIRRDTAAVDYRYTPTDNWDIRANYSNMRRTGSQVDGVLFTGTNNGSRVDVAKPVADTTQNFGVNGEYSGTSAWGQKFNAIVGYNGSVYQDDFNNYTVQNPFCNGTTVSSTTCAGNGTLTGPLAMMSTPPNNQMNGVTGTLGADLPFNSRYMGTVAYSGMRQNDSFLPFSINALNLAAPGGGTLPGASLSTIPALIRTQAGTGVTSLNGSINTLLVNNVVTTQINSDLKTKLSYRYYNYDNQTPELNVFDWAIADACSTALPAASGGCNHPTYGNVNTLSLGYIKQNAGAEATWRPVNSVNIGGAYGYEHYDFTRADASSTGENSGKVYADWKPTSWITTRASALVSERRAGNYDYLGNVGLFQWQGKPTPNTIPAGMPNGTTNYSPYYRQLYLDDRDRAQAKFSVDVKVLNNLTVTPTFNVRNDTYIFSQNQEGLTSDRSYAAGIEAAYVATPDATFLFSYMNERRSQNVVSAGNTLLCPYTSSAAACLTSYTAAQLYSANVQDRVNTFIFGVNYAVIPQKFDVHLGYTLSMGNNSQPLFFANGNGPQSGGFPAFIGTTANPGQFPDVNTTFQRVDATAKYIVDQDFVTSLGLKGEVALKLRYAWERNSVANWNNDTMQPYMYTAGMNMAQAGYVQWLAGNNPNYNVHLLGGSVTFAW
ncbi:MAG: MtrB/PioB family outer membrane beta-barrel protein [Bradyrhizobium sp.]